MKFRRPLILIGKTVFLVLFCCPMPTRAQNSLSISAPACAPEDLDADIRIFTGHDSSQALDTKLLNVSGHACYLRGDMATNFMTVNIEPR